MLHRKKSQRLIPHQQSRGTLMTRLVHHCSKTVLFLFLTTGLFGITFLQSAMAESSDSHLEGNQPQATADATPAPVMMDNMPLDPASPTQAIPPEITKTKVKIETTKGAILVELEDVKAPISVENFISYIEQGFYDGLIFHRIIPNFMIQGGGFNPNMILKTTRSPIKNEAKNGLSNLRGTIAMARTSVVDSATSQFFINLVDNAHLDHGVRDFGYAVFGRVIDGMSVVDTIAQTPTNQRGMYSNVPTEPITIIKVVVLGQTPQTAQDQPVEGASAEQ